VGLVKIGKLPGEGNYSVGLQLLQRKNITNVSHGGARRGKYYAKPSNINPQQRVKRLAQSTRKSSDEEVRE